MAACPSTGLLQATKMSPCSLEDLAMTAYLANLQDACAVYIQERIYSVPLVTSHSSVCIIMANIAMRSETIHIKENSKIILPKIHHSLGEL